MKSIFFALVFFYSLSSFALNFSVEGPKGNQMLSKKIDIEVPSNVGEITVLALNESGIIYDGSDIGIHEMFGLTNEVEIISKSEMKAWGWCFSLDGEVPETLTHQTPVESLDSEIVWFYAYAHYLEGEWIGQCIQD